jgi:hypothetical protein
MKLPFIVQRQNLIKELSHLIFILFLFAISSCVGGHDTSESVSYTFSIKWPADVPTIELSNSVSKAIDCNAANVETVEATFYDESDNYLTGGVWSCTAHSGTVYGIPAGINRRVVFTGEDSG